MHISYIFGKSVHDIFISETDWRIGLVTKELEETDMSIEEYERRVAEIEKLRRS